MTTPASFPSVWPRPDKRKIIEGKYCRLEPIQLSHIKGLYDVIAVSDAKERYSFLLTMPKGDRSEEDHRAWITPLIDSPDPMIYTVFDKSTDTIVGRFNLMRIVPEHGVAEIGGVLWGPSMARSRIATETLYLTASYVFDELKYRRFEWKCHK
jgi:RimJ/RimL family protein N-acetyltransferase